MKIQSRQSLISQQIRSSLMELEGSYPSQSAQHDDFGIKLNEIKMLLDSLNKHAQVGSIPEAEHPKERGPLKTVKTVVRRLMRPFWERQTAYNLANADLGDKFAKMLADNEECQGDLYLRTIHMAEDKLNSLVQLMRQELAHRDQKISDLERRLRKIESRDGEEK